MFSCFFLPILKGLFTALLGGGIIWYYLQDKIEALSKNNKILSADFESLKSSHSDLESQYNAHKLRSEEELNSWKIKNQTISTKLSSFKAGDKLTPQY